MAAGTVAKQPWKRRVEGVGWVGMRWDGMRWDGVGWDAVGWGRVRRVLGKKNNVAKALSRRFGRELRAGARRK